MNRRTEPRWGLIFLLAALGLVSIAGVYDASGGGSWPPVLVTGAIAAIWGAFLGLVATGFGRLLPRRRGPGIT